MSRKPKRPKWKRIAPKDWEQFEKAVFTFLRSLLKEDPNANVQFNPPKTDADTGNRQQVDAWIDYKVGGHIPLPILVSCKSNGRPLDVGHVRVFLREIEDSGARGGAIYSRSGFTKAAILKASRNGIGCFELWRNRPADVPRIKVRNYYACYDSMALPVFHRGQSEFDPQTWDELFDTVVTLDGTSDTLENHINRAFCAGRELSLAEHRKQPKMVFPESWYSELRLDESLPDGPKITFAGGWRKFRSRPFATLLSGSFCVSTGEFSGTEQSPPISPAFPPPQKEWEEIMANIENEVGTPSIMLTKSSARMAVALRGHIGSKPMY